MVKIKQIRFEEFLCVINTERILTTETLEQICVFVDCYPSYVRMFLVSEHIYRVDPKVIWIIRACLGNEIFTDDVIKNLNENRVIPPMFPDEWNSLTLSDEHICLCLQTTIYCFEKDFLPDVYVYFEIIVRLFSMEWAHPNIRSRDVSKHI